MFPTSPLQFAREASSRLQVVVSDLCSHTNPVYHQFCNDIQTTLFYIVPRFQTLPDTESFRDEACDLLSDLEKLCQPRHPANPVAPPTESGTWLAGPGLHYPALVLLLEDAGSATEAIKEFASGDKHVPARRRLLNRLKDFRGLTPDSASSAAFCSLSDTVVQAQNGAPPEYGKEILLLHSTLSKYCFCIKEHPHRSTAACVRLSSCSSDDSKVTFGLLFMDHPHQNTAGMEPQPWWQDTEISLYRTVQIEGGKPGGGSRCQVEIGLESALKSSFCYFITHQRKRGPMLLHFSVTGTSVGRKKSAEKGLFIDRFESDRPRRWSVERPSISLRDLLKTASAEDFSEKKKEVLSVFLAKAVWQYYSSPWMAKPWTKDSVHFIFEQRRTGQNEELAGIFVDEPLLSVSISAPKPSSSKAAEACSDRKQNTEDEDDDDDFFSSEGPVFSFQATHQLPKILALGVMLMEIQLGRPIESLYNNPKFSHHCPKEIAYPDTDYNICKDLIEKENIYMVKETSDPLSNLITNCILPRQIFMPPRVRSLSDDDIRPVLYHLVSQLELWNSARQPHNVRPLSLPDVISSNWAVPAPTPAAPQRLPLERPNDELRCGRVMAQITNSKTTEDWFSRMHSLIHILKARDEDQDTYEKVKIAVLDTGVHPNHVEADYIKGYKDFVSGEDGVKRDNTGHGTTSIRLILDMCESADVYALRIFERDTAAKETQHLAAEALEWCITNTMDVVCMACGFSEDDATLYHKIREASCKMLLIAAPTNEGNKHNILYPAAYGDFVLPMFATDGNVKKSNLNPSKGPGKYNFAILGEDIKNVHDEVNSGTSYSTAIAAGFAARLLDFSRHSDTKVEFGDKAQKLKSKHGFIGVLVFMALRTIDGPFHCVRPWDLLPTELQSQLPFQPSGLPGENTTASARHQICQKICMGISREFG
ncbi:hypothetical protein B0T16DRAFT_420502 [Cercophora newfieldiana]|uniref:Peptidase S8/S53 domain-containing protein n=1 Tax=Cercophora newfieldiana TaxID=92897 RepID=A0AA39XXV7_9PEZI|nr:hypothetical protein B0T16DRAFT_420502 [Cercophora newfieldiana]